MRHLEFSFQFRSPCINPEWQPGQAKPYHTKPSHFRSVFGPFWPFFGLKTPKNKRIWFQGLWPLKVHLWVVYFSLVPLLVKFIRFRNASDYMCMIIWWYCLIVSSFSPSILNLASACPSGEEAEQPISISSLSSKLNLKQYFEHIPTSLKGLEKN